MATGTRAQLLVRIPRQDEIESEWDGFKELLYPDAPELIGVRVRLVAVKRWHELDLDNPRGEGPPVASDNPEWQNHLAHVDQTAVVLGATWIVGPRAGVGDLMSLWVRFDDGYTTALDGGEWALADGRQVHYVPDADWEWPL